MAGIQVISGVKTVISNLRKQKKALAAGCERGVKLAGMHLLRVSQQKVPVDFGVLKASGFARATGKGFATQLNIGYNAFYALFVHENVEMKLKGQPRKAPSKGKYWDPQGKGQSKFLEEPARTEAPTLRKIIRDNTRVRRIR